MASTKESTKEILARLKEQKEGNYGTRQSGEDLKNKPDFTKTNVKSDKKAETKKTKTKKTETKKSTSSFGTAFADARKAGKKTFMWNGKSYNTKRADDKPAPKKAAPKAERAKGSEGFKPTKTDIGPNMNKVNKPDAKADTRSTMEKLFGVSEERRQMGRDLQKKAQASMGFKHGGNVKKMKHGGSVKSHRGDGICKKGKTRGRMV